MAPANREPIELRGKTVDDAVQRALKQLRLARAEVEVTVLSEGRAGVFGIGATSALVRVTPHGSGASTSAAASEEPLPKIDDYAEYEELPPRTAGDGRGRRPARGGGEGRGDGRGARRGSRGGSRGGRSRSHERPDSSAPVQQEPFELLADPEFEPHEDAIKHAVNVVTDLLHLIGVRADVTSRAPETPMDGLDHAMAVIEITAASPDDDLSLLIGEEGQHLTALQYIANVVLSRSLEGQHPITVDVGGYKRRRETELNELARSGAEEARASRETVELQPMTPAERRIVHLALSEESDVVTESAGEGDARRVMIVYREGG